MGKVVFRLETEEARAVQGFMRLVEAQKRTEDGANKLGRAGKRAGRRTAEGTKEAQGGLEKMGTAAISSMRAIVTGMVGVGGVTAALGMINREAGKTRVAIAELVAESKGLDVVVQKVANQMGQATSVGGFAVSADIVKAVVRAGRFGADYERGEAAAIGGHVAFGETDKPLAGEALETTKFVAEWAGWKKIDAEVTGGVFKLLGQVGAKKRDDVAVALRKMNAAYTKAASFSESASYGGMMKFVADLMAQGSTLEGGLAEYVQGVGSTGSEDIAARRVRTMTDVLRKPQLVKAMAKDMGVSEEDVMAMPLDERKAAFGRWAAKYEKDEKALAAAGLPPRQMGWAITMYGGGGQEAIAKRKEWLGGMRAETLYKNLENFGKTPQARGLETDTETALLPMLVSEKTKAGQKYLLYARKIRQLQRADELSNLVGAEPGEWAWAAGAFRGMEAETQITAAEMLKIRGERLKMAYNAKFGRGAYGKYREGYREAGESEESWRLRRGIGRARDAVFGIQADPGEGMFGTEVTNAIEVGAVLEKVEPLEHQLGLPRRLSEETLRSGTLDNETVQKWMDALKANTDALDRSTGVSVIAPAVD